MKHEICAQVEEVRQIFICSYAAHVFYKKTALEGPAESRGLYEREGDFDKGLEEVGLDPSPQSPSALSAAKRVGEVLVMQANDPHALKAVKPFKMLLTMVK